MLLTRTPGHSGGPGYLPGIDGLRAIAVLAVLLFHGDVTAVSGGFLGVEVFFVVSGYLITLLLLREFERDGRFRLRAFWGRRLRRLLPAAGVVVLASLAYALAFLPEEVSGLRGDALSAAGYATNWWLVFGNQPYFETLGRPSLLQHLWSLAVEEQFYLVWPIVFLALLKLLGRRGALLVTVLAMAGSYALMAALHDPAVDPARLYYGTDTRAGGLLAGAALAMAWDPGKARAGGTGTRLAVTAAGCAGLLAIGWAFLTIDASTGWLYPWGFVIVAAGASTSIVAATHPGSKGLPRLLGSGSMRWAGTRSYGLYLWHWPLFVLTRPGVDVPFDGLDLLAGRLALAALAAEVSYRFVEQPFRAGAVSQKFRSAFGRAPIRARLLAASGGLSAFALVFTAFHAPDATVPYYLAEGGFHGVVGAPLVGVEPASSLVPFVEVPPDAESSTTPEVPAAASASAVDEATPEATAVPAQEPATPPSRRRQRLQLHRHHRRPRAHRSSPSAIPSLMGAAPYLSLRYRRSTLRSGATLARWSASSRAPGIRPYRRRGHHSHGEQRPALHRPGGCDGGSSGRCEGGAGHGARRQAVGSREQRDHPVGCSSMGQRPRCRLVRGD
ncbi:acyltransferase [Candidatus Amarobacter glycogenicus]|uniref:acyltransferase family protein n=1 Tax=Candidatus Amarobacter glycogenicus TaxID=3140699 RepID=UPI002A17543D|nr:acyltransferase [Dehalococcoidia bacterium]